MASKKKKARDRTDREARGGTKPPQGIPAGRLSEQEIRAHLERLRSDAKERDARCFMIAVLLYCGLLRGSGDEYQAEMHRTYKDFVTLLAQLKRQNAFYLCVKVSLFLYCHIVETRSLYVYLHNLIQIARGFEYEQYPFSGDSIDNKVKRIKKISTTSDYLVEEMLDEVIQLNIRNAFSHNRYLITPSGLTLSETDYFINYSDLFRVVSKTQALYSELTDAAMREIQALSVEGVYTFEGNDGKVLVVTAEKSGPQGYLRIEGL